MIPKNLIYCNFGNMNIRKNIEQRCMLSWEKFFPKKEWRWIEINETNYNIHKNFYIQDAYNKHNYNLVSDYARFDVLYQYGGIYVDTDMLFLKMLPQEIFSTDNFCIGTIGGIQSLHTDIFSWGFIIAPKENDHIQGILNMCSTQLYKISCKTTPLILLTAEKYLKQFYYNIDTRQINQPLESNHITIYPADYFTANIPQCYIFNITNHTIAIHLFGSSWVTYNTLYNVEKIIQRRLIDIYDS